MVVISTSEEIMSSTISLKTFQHQLSINWTYQARNQRDCWTFNNDLQLFQLKSILSVRLDIQILSINEVKDKSSNKTWWLLDANTISIHFKTRTSSFYSSWISWNYNFD